MYAPCVLWTDQYGSHQTHEDLLYFTDDLEAAHEVAALAIEQFGAFKFTAYLDYYVRIFPAGAPEKVLFKTREWSASSYSGDAAAKLLLATAAQICLVAYILHAAKEAGI